MEEDFSSYAILILKDLPNGTTLGIDMQAYVVGDTFVGVKMIPPGGHFIYWSPIDSNGDGCIRYGLMQYFKAGDILVKQWNDEKNELENKFISETEKLSIKNSYDEIEDYLLQYETESISKWNNISCFITDYSIIKLNPPTGIVRPFAELISDANFDRKTYKQDDINLNKRKMKLNFLQDDDIDFPFLTPDKDTIPNFTKLPERCPKSSTSSEITQHYMDCKEAVDSIFKIFDNDIELMLAEIQYSYIIFILNYSIEGLVQWRKFLLILSNSESSIKKYLNFYMKYINILMYQLPELPEELLNASSNNLIYRDVKKLLINSNEIQQMKEIVKRFTTQLNKSICWFVEDNLFAEDPEDLPVIVEDIK